MNIHFDIKGKYTVIIKAGFKGGAEIHEIIIKEFSERKKRYLYQRKGNRKNFLFPNTGMINNMLIFHGHNLPLTLSGNEGNAEILSFNFKTNNPSELQAFIINNCLNSAVANFRCIFYTTDDNLDCFTRLFPDRAEDIKNCQTEGITEPQSEQQTT